MLETVTLERPFKPLCLIIGGEVCRTMKKKGGGSVKIHPSKRALKNYWGLGNVLKWFDLSFIPWKNLLFL